MIFCCRDFSIEMKSIRDWVFAQLEAGSLVLPRPLLSNSCLEEEVQNKELTSSGSPQSGPMEVLQLPADTPHNSDGTQESQTVTPSQQAFVNDPLSHNGTERKDLDPLSKIEALQINFFRVLRRLGQSPEDILVAKVLYRIHLATLIRARESDLKRISLSSDNSRALAAEQEAAGHPVLDFSLRILVLGKTGVGKSATINSLFNQKKAITNAFRPGTDHIEEVTGFVNGVKMTVIDTPGFWPSSPSNLRRNRKIMHSINRYIRKSPPDVVLYLERLDNLQKGYSDFPLLRLLTEVFGPAMWFNTILVMTHSAGTLPEGPNGYPISYDSYVTHCTDLLQRYVQLAVSDAKLENPVVLVENHPTCKTNMLGEKILPNGQIWKQQLLFLCMCTKVLGDANALLGLQNSIELGPSSNSRLPSLPHLLSSFLRQRPVMNPDGAEEANEFSALDDEDEEEYDQLPPIRILKKSEFQKLSKSQKRAYLDELDYRETLFLKKQLKEELRRRRDRKLQERRRLDDEDNPDAPEALPEPAPLPDMAMPPTFDSDYPIYRYQGVITSDQWFWRPVLDPHGWDHDMGLDGVNLETATEVKRNLTVAISGQMSKDKHDFSIHSQSAVAFADPRGPTYSVGLDVQSSGADMIYTVHSHAKLGNVKHNVPGCGVSVMSFQKKHYIGMKVEDTLLVGKRLKLTMNAGRMGVGGQGAAAYGGSLEATVRGRDYPVRNDKMSVTMTALSFNKELVLGGSLETEFRPKRGMRLSVNGNLNTQKMGQISIKTTSSEHLEIAFIAFFTIFRAICRRKEPNSSLDGAQEME